MAASPGSGCSSHLRNLAVAGSTPWWAGAHGHSRAWAGEKETLHGLWAAGRGLLSPEEDEISVVKQVKNIPRREDEQRKNRTIWGAVPGTCLDPSKGPRSSVLFQEQPGNRKANSPSYSREQVIKLFIVPLSPKLSKLQGQEKMFLQQHRTIWAQSQACNWCSTLKRMIACFLFF